MIISTCLVSNILHHISVKKPTAYALCHYFYHQAAALLRCNNCMNSYTYVCIGNIGSWDLKKQEL